MNNNQEERMKILTMIEKGQITAAEGSELLKALQHTPPSAPRPDIDDKPRRLRLNIIDQKGEKRLNIALPLGLVKVGLKMGAKLGTSVEGVSEKELLSAIREAVQAGVKGPIATIETDMGEILQVVVE